MKRDRVRPVSFANDRRSNRFALRPSSTSIAEALTSQRGAFLHKLRIPKGIGELKNGPGFVSAEIPGQVRLNLPNPRPRQKKANIGASIPLEAVETVNYHPVSVTSNTSFDTVEKANSSGFTAGSAGLSVKDSRAMADFGSLLSGQLLRLDHHSWTNDGYLRISARCGSADV